MRCVVPGLLASAVWVAGCGVEKDDRPLNLEYMTAAVFAPSCGLTQCHSTFAQVDNLVFDTPEGVRRSLVREQWRDGAPALQFDSDHPDPMFPYTSRLYTLISTTDPFPFEGADYGRIPRMPLDAPLPNKDVDLLVTWLKDPSVVTLHGEFGVGERARGAQCDPEQNPGSYACDDDQVVVCDDDWNFGQLVVDCMGKGCRAKCEIDPADPDHCDPMTMCKQ